MLFDRFTGTCDLEDPGRQNFAIDLFGMRTTNVKYLLSAAPCGHPVFDKSSLRYEPVYSSLTKFCVNPIDS